MIYELAIIGSSAAGMSAAIYAARAGLNFLIVSKDIGGNLAKAGVIENYLGFPKISGRDLAKKFERHLELYKPKIISDEVKELSKKDTYFLIKTTGQEFETKTVIIATGATPKTLNIPGEKDYSNKGISYCETCDGPLFSDRKVAVIGGGNSATKAVLALSKIVSHLYLLTTNKALKAEKIYTDKIGKLHNLDIFYETKTLDFFGGKFLEGLDYQDIKTKARKSLEVEGAFIYVGLAPNTDFIDKSLDILNDKQEVVVDRLGRTKIAGLFGAGDVTDGKYRQILVAAGEGTKAALSAIDYLEEN